jgi:hypothetical protein
MAMAHESQTLQMRAAVAAIAVRLARGRGQQAGLFVIADGFHFDAGGTAEVADLHAFIIGN